MAPRGTIRTSARPIEGTCTGRVRQPGTAEPDDRRRGKILLSQYPPNDDNHRAPAPNAPDTHTHTHTHSHTHRSFTFFARRQSGLGDRSRFTHPEASVSLARERAPPQPKSNHRESVGILIAQDTHAPKTPRNLPNQSKMRRARSVQDTELLVPGILATVLHAPRSRASVAQYRAPDDTRRGKASLSKDPRTEPHRTPGTEHHHQRTTRATVIRRIVKWSGERTPRRRQEMVQV